ncbi:hypothetical protein [Desulfosporosinus sp. FKA]|uniref:hypothetical protein n=1 Tax=Desulfosporosinus sp. FKA TaxID=1969834 RepID=UPI000B49B330|nr:hypothetical protein [Desulfosporosinus sp. FKA]
MTNGTFIYSMRVSGIERKKVANAIAGVLGMEIEYMGAPTFCYRVGKWVIDREGLIISPEVTLMERDSFCSILDTLKTAEAIAEGDATVTLSMTSHNGNTLRNLVNLLWCKQSLIRKSLARVTDIIPESLITAINSVPIDTLEEVATVINVGIDNGVIKGDCQIDFNMAEKTLSSSFFNASLDIDEIFAFAFFCQQLSKQSIQQKFSSIKIREAVNEKYAMRCFLLKLGLIGEAYKVARKILLKRLDGDSSYRTIEAKQAAEAKRKKIASEN